MRILLVEDNRDILANLADYLDMKGYSVDCAQDGLSGLHLAATEHYDLIVLDVMLPGLDGYTLCRRLREDARRETPVIMLTARDQLDDALHIREEEELPVYQRLGNVREIAVCQGKIADILYTRGQLDEALTILQQEALPAFGRLGDVRAIAICQGKIADILHARGQLDEALTIREQEQLPVFEHLGDVRSALIARANLALNLLQRAAPGDRDKARSLLCLALADARRLRIPEAGQIEDIIQQHNLQPKA